MPTLKALLGASCSVAYKVYVRRLFAAPHRLCGSLTRQLKDETLFEEHGAPDEQ
jgi:hypothetical protein